MTSHRVDVLRQRDFEADGYIAHEKKMEMVRSTGIELSFFGILPERTIPIYGSENRDLLMISFYFVWNPHRSHLPITERVTTL